MEMKMNVEKHGEILQKQGVVKSVFEKVKPIIWIVKVLGKDPNGDYLTSTFTAFAVDKKGYLLSCTHSWHSWESPLFVARRLTDIDNFKIEATLVDMNLSCDVCLLKVPLELNDNECGKLGSGSLTVNETIISIGHPNDLVGSGLIGYVVYPCIGVDQEFEYNDSQICETYLSTSLDNSPSYRVMGDIWNDDYFTDSCYAEDFCKNLKAKLPIIQAAGLVGGEGISGAPIFNLQGEIVGMFVMGYFRYDIGIHVAALEKFLAKNQIFPNEES